MPEANKNYKEILPDEGKESTLAKALDAETNIVYDKERDFIIADKSNPDRFVYAHTSPDVFNDKPYTKATYSVHSPNGKTKEFSDERFEGRGKYFWWNLKKEMASVGGFDSKSTLLKFYNENDFRQWQTQAKNQNMEMAVDNHSNNINSEYSKTSVSNTPTPNPYWGNTKAAEISDRKYINVSMDIVKNSDIAQQFEQQNIKFLARNNEMLSISNIMINNSDYSNALNIVKNATQKLMPDIEMNENIWGNTNYGDIPDKKIMVMGNEVSSKIHLNELLNNNNISFSAREYPATQATAITINKADSERVENLIRSALNPVQGKEQNVQYDNQQPKHSKITVSSDLRLKIGQELLKNDIAFSTNVDTANKTAVFTVNTQDMPFLNDIIANISKELVKENVVETAHIKSEELKEIKQGTAKEQITAQTNGDSPVQSIKLAETIQALREMAEKKGLEFDNSSHKPPVIKAYDLLNSIDTNTFKSTAEERISVKPTENIPIDFGDKISPIFKLSMNNHENTLNRLFEKNDTLNVKIEKNQSRIEVLNDKISTLQHNNSLYTAIKNSVPFAKGIVDKLIEQNNKEIKNIKENKIPKREQKIAKHKDKIEKNNVSISDTMMSLKQISAVNKFITGFKSMNADERRDSFISGLTAIANNSMNNALGKRNKAVIKLKTIADEFNNTDRTPLTVISAQNEEISKLSNVIEKQQNKLEKAAFLVSNLERVLNGELLQNKVEEVIETTENAVANEIVSSNITENSEISGEELADNIVDTASKVIESAVERENQIENNIKPIEENIENNYNSIDGVINNLPVEDNKEVRLGDDQRESSFSSNSQNDMALNRDERSENSNPMVEIEKEIMSAISAITGFTTSQLDTLPKDVKMDIIEEYKLNKGNVHSEAFTSEIAAILNVEPIKNIDNQPKIEKPKEEKAEKNNQHNLFENSHSNNESKEENKRKSRFSINDLNSPKYEPRSDKNEIDKQNTQNRKRDVL